jgi:curli biogenesis system outer membrane secretion channel CsgG
MKTNLIRSLIAVAILGFAPLLAHGQGKESLAVGIVQTNKALVDDMVRKGKIIELERVVGSLDHQLISALVQSRKFSIVGRSDLKQLLDEQNLGASGIVDASTAPEQGKVRGAKYKLVATVDSFLDENAVATFASGRKATKRRFQLSAQAVIYDTTTSEAIESSNFQVEKSDVLDAPDGQVSDAKRTDELMPAVAREMSEKIANRTVEVLLPAKIVDKDDKQVTINRGDSFGLKVGEVWTVFGPTKTITDPDSGEVIKRKGGLLGRIKITSVEPTYSQGELLEDKGVVVGSVVSRPQ